MISRCSALTDQPSVDELGGPASRAARGASASRRAGRSCPACATSPWPKCHRQTRLTITRAVSGWSGSRQPVGQLQPAAPVRRQRRLRRRRRGRPGTAAATTWPGRQVVAADAGPATSADLRPRSRPSRTAAPGRPSPARPARRSQLLQPAGPSHGRRRLRPVSALSRSLQPARPRPVVVGLRARRLRPAAAERVLVPPGDLRERLHRLACCGRCRPGRSSPPA